MRPWRNIAQELSVEKDSKRIDQLADELNRALLMQTGFANVPAKDGGAFPLPKPKA